MGPSMPLWEVATTHFFVALCSICSYTLLWGSRRERGHPVLGSQSQCRGDPAAGNFEKWTECSEQVEPGSQCSEWYRVMGSVLWLGV